MILTCHFSSEVSSEAGKDSGCETQEAKRIPGCLTIPFLCWFFLAGSLRLPVSLLRE